MSGKQEWLIILVDTPSQFIEENAKPQGRKRYVQDNTGHGQAWTIIQIPECTESSLVVLQIHRVVLSFPRIKMTKMTSSQWKTCDSLGLLIRTCFSLVYKTQLLQMLMSLGE